jgi:oligopeptide/dipeptide ABC transporter ATP-binding protein
LLVTGIGLMIVLCVTAVVAPILWGHAAERISSAVRAGASGDHPLGTDALGRDVLARTLVATRTTLLMAATSIVLSTVIGTTLGATTALVGGWLRNVGERLIDLMVAFPPIIIALAVTAILGPGTESLVIAIGLAFTPQFARLVNRLAVRVNNADFVVISRLLGVPKHRIATRHVIPNTAGPVLVLISVGFASAIVTASGLSFVGLGVQAPSFDWGQLLAEGLRNLYNNPITAVGPAAGILLAGLASGLIGDALSQGLDVKGAVDRRSDRTSGTDPVGGGAVIREPGAATADGAMVVRNLVIRRGGAGGAPIVRGVSLTVARGEIVGIVGESGSGKSLTAMALAGLVPGSLTVTADELRVGALSLLGGAPPRELATELGVVFQDPSSSFNPALHLGTQLTEVLRKHKGVSKRSATEMAIERLAEVKVSDPAKRVHQYPHELSGGMRQRAMIAMALLPEPRALIADEPTTALDITVQGDVLRLLRSLNREYHMAVLLISHDISVVSALCDRVCVMYAGRVVEVVGVDALSRGEVVHPYTRALLAATPRGAVRSERLVALAGRPPAPGEIVRGCSFADRCPLAMDRCREDDPVLQGAADHTVACHAVTASTEGVLGHA